MHHLVPPLQLPRLVVERDHRGGEQVLTGAVAAVVVRPCVAGREVEEPEVRVDRRRLPDRCAARLPRVARLRPCVVARFPRPRDRVEAPKLLARGCVVRCDAAARAELAARDARDHLAVDVERRVGDRVAVLPPGDLRRPRNLAGLLVERNELPVELSDVNSAVADRDATALPAAAHDRDRLVEVRLVLPEDLTRVDADGEHVVLTRRHVDHALVLERLALGRVLRGDARLAKVRQPHTLQL
jgi:hypothetical protein